ncbi:spermidine synthase (plasmid) [Legionella adelaidensis]|uniref:Spermidine synthase n=1 Tax=Legionella adelaidensis TaxID=45056 RepID=A0A0W0R2L8_9GAMM|nr:fused MFS/spermidine synthase [Legionella adelaidensis]KTC65334.1 spermidine synthase [Legionella adelaidensis]VEH86015.1 spermidine synthase [Legionella adelaidensis]
MLNFIFTILLVEGFITISVEILTIRQLIPFYGSSVVITSIIIGIFLLFLAIGYWRGGTFQKDFFKKLNQNFILSLLWIGIGLSYFFISFFFYGSVYFLKFPILLSLFLFLMLILSPIVYWLGQTVPLVTNLFSQSLRISSISGRALFLSTIGSFLGALLTSLVLFQWLGVAWTVLINCCLLFILIAYIQQKDGEVSFLRLMILVMCLLFIAFLNVVIEHGQFKKTNNYANYRILEQDDFSKILLINDSYSSLITPDKKIFPYAAFIRSLLFEQLKLQNKKILIIGAGGFTLSAAGTNNNDITYIDIDPAIKDIVEKDFLNEPVKGKFKGEDARSFLLKENSLYDVIVSDVYSNQNMIPPALVTREYFQSISTRLNNNGLAIFNIISNPLFTDEFSQVLFNTIHSVFRFCAVIPLKWDHALANIIFVCPKKRDNQSIYSDDLNRSTLDFFKLNQK